MGREMAANKLVRQDWDNYMIVSKYKLFGASIFLRKSFIICIDSQNCFFGYSNCLNGIKNLSEYSFCSVFELVHKRIRSDFD